MSVRDVLNLTKEYSQDANPESFTFALIQHLLQVIKEISDLCEQKNWDIKSIPMFDLKQNEYQIGILQIYEQLYYKDCKRARSYQEDAIRARVHKTIHILRGLPQSWNCLSKIILPFLEHLHDRRVRLKPVPNRESSRQISGNPIPFTKQAREIDDDDLYYIGNRLKASHNRIHDEVFGPEIQHTSDYLVLPNKDKPVNQDIKDDQSYVYSEDSKLQTQLAAQSFESQYGTVQPQIKELNEVVSINRRQSMDTTSLVRQDQFEMKQKKLKRFKKETDQSQGEYIWPFKDSYVPNAKMLPQDVRLIHQSMKQKLLPKAHENQQFTIDMLQERAIAMKKIQGTFKVRVQNQVGKRIGNREVRQSNNRWSQTFDAKNQKRKDVELPLIKGNNDQLIQQFDRETKIKQGQVPPKVQSYANKFTPILETSLPGNHGRSNSHSNVMGFEANHYLKKNASLQNLQKLNQSSLEADKLYQPFSAQKAESDFGSENFDDIKVQSVDRQRLMPQFLCDYDPIQNGFKFQIQSIVNVDDKETSIYKIVAQINSYSFIIDEPDLEKSKCGQYCFDHQAQPVMYQKLQADSCVLFFLSRYNVVTGKTTKNFAYAVYPLIHLLDKRQFLICGKYYLPLYSGYPPKELFEQKTKIRNILKNQSKNLILGQSLLVQLGEASDQIKFDNDPSFLHCVVDNRHMQDYETKLTGDQVTLKNKLLEMDDGQGKWMGLVQNALKQMQQA